MTIGPTFADPVARQLYAEIASIEEQHVTQYGSLLNPDETWLEKWLIHEATEVYLYHACMQQEPNPRVKAIWERFLDYELGHLTLVRKLFEDHEKRDAQEILGGKVPEMIEFTSQRDFVRKVVAEEVDLRTRGPDFVAMADEGRQSRKYRDQLNADGSPSQTASTGYRWTAGTELMRDAETV
jgi:hypothetical protein